MDMVGLSFVVQTAMRAGSYWSIVGKTRPQVSHDPISHKFFAASFSTCPTLFFFTYSRTCLFSKL
jgi:hypothetical protein